MKRFKLDRQYEFFLLNLILKSDVLYNIVKTTFGNKQRMGSSSVTDFDVRTLFEKKKKRKENVVKNQQVVNPI